MDGNEVLITAAALPAQPAALRRLIRDGTGQTQACGLITRERKAGSDMPGLI